MTPTMTRITADRNMVITDNFKWMSTLPLSSSYAGPRKGNVPIDDVRIHESIMPIAPAASVSTSASNRNCHRMCAFFGTKGAAQADFPDPFVYRHQHDIHYANAANSERHRAD